MPVELTESARRKLARAKAAGLIKGKSNKIDQTVARAQRRQRRQESALDMAQQAFRRAQGIGPGKRANQSTDSNQ